ncbi:hypothetical protein ACWC0C_38580 [Streptomyces sp. NPDC001709]
MNVDYPDHGEPPIRSVLVWPKCSCGHPECPDIADDQPKYEGPDDRSFSPAMQRIRPGIEKENRRACWGV